MKISPSFARRPGAIPGLLVLIALLGAPPEGAKAQATPTPVYQVTSYLWAAGAGGSFRPTIQLPVLEIDRSFRELAEDLELAFLMSGMIRLDRVVLLGDFSYLSLSRQGFVPVPGVGPVPATGALRQSSVTLLGGYRALEEPRFSVDLLGGVRTWRLRSDVTVPPAGIERSPRHRFTDPLLAVRGMAQLSDRWSFLGYVDGGGFGLGSESTLQAVAAVNLELTESVFLSTGYRRLSVNYEGVEGSFADLTSAGFLLGLTLRF